MTGKNFDKWMKDAGVIDGKDITTTMTGIAFSKVVGYALLVKKTLNELRSKKKANFSETKQVLANVAIDRAKQSKRDAQVDLILFSLYCSDCRPNWTKSPTSSVD